MSTIHCGDYGNNDLRGFFSVWTYKKNSSPTRRSQTRKKRAPRKRARKEWTPVKRRSCRRLAKRPCRASRGWWTRWDWAWTSPGTRQPNNNNNNKCPPRNPPRSCQSKFGPDKDRFISLALLNFYICVFIAAFAKLPASVKLHGVREYLYFYFKLF